MCDANRHLLRLSLNCTAVTSTSIYLGGGAPQSCFPFVPVTRYRQTFGSPKLAVLHTARFNMCLFATMCCRTPKPVFSADYREER